MRSNEDAGHEQLLNVLLRLGQKRISESEATAKLREGVTLAGSATESNIACGEHLEVKTVVDTDYASPRWVTAVTLRGKAVKLSDVFAEAEDIRVPSRVAALGVTKSEWMACMRFALHVFTGSVGELATPVRKPSRRR